MREPTGGSRRKYRASGSANARGTAASGSASGKKPTSRAFGIAKAAPRTGSEIAKALADVISSPAGKAILGDPSKKTITYKGKKHVTWMQETGVSGVAGAAARAAAKAVTKAVAEDAAPAAAKAAAKVKPPVKPLSMINKQRRASVAAIERKTGTPAPKIGAEKPAPAAPKAGPKKAPPTVPPSKGVKIKTETSTKAKPQPVKKPSAKPVQGAAKIPPAEPDKAKFATEAAYKQAMTTWKKKMAAYERANRTPIQVEREAAQRARQKAAGMDRPSDGATQLLKPAKGSAESRVQEKAAKTAKSEAETANAKKLMQPEKSKTTTGVGKAKLGDGTRGARRPSAGTAAPKRERYKTQAGYDRALAAWKAKGQPISDSLSPAKPNAAAGKPLPETRPKPPAVKKPAAKPAAKAAPKSAAPAAEPKAKAPAAKKPTTPKRQEVPTREELPANAKKGKLPAKRPGTDLVPVRKPTPKGAAPTREPVDLVTRPVSRKPIAAIEGPKPSAAKPKTPSKDVAVRPSKVADRPSKLAKPDAKGKKKIPWKKAATGAAAAGAVGTAVAMSGKRKSTPAPEKKYRPGKVNPAPTGKALVAKAIAMGMPKTHGKDKSGKHVSDVEYARRWMYRNKRKNLGRDQSAYEKAKENEMARRKKYRQRVAAKAS